MLTYIKKHKFITALIIIVLIGGGYFIYTKAHSGNLPIQYVTQAAAKTTITVAVTGTGQVAASDQVDIKPQNSGTITAVDVKQGQQVKAGDVIATIDNTTAANQVRQAQASLEQAQASYQTLVEGPTATDLAPTQLSVQAAQQSLDQANANLPIVQAQQQADVNKAFFNMMNDGLQAMPNNTLSSGTLTITGNYTGTDKGTYTINLYPTGGGLYYSATGLGTGNGPVTSNIPEPIGAGLFITFGNINTYNAGTQWTITLPNINATSYVNDLNAYNSALQSQTQSVNQAQSAITSAQNQLAQAQANLSTKTEAPTQAALDNAQAQVASAQAALSTAQQNYDNNIIKAPFDGTIAALDVNTGDQGSAGTAIATEVTNEQYAQISLNEVDVAKIAVGDPVTMTFDALSGLTLTGKVAEIDTIGTVTQGVVTYDVKISFDTQNDQVKPGMSVTANIITNVATDVLAVPSAAVQGSGTATYVQVLGSNGQPQNVPVQTGISNATMVQITSGLNEGDKVVTQTINPNLKTTAATGATSAAGAARGLTGGAGFGGAGFGGGAAVRVTTGAAGR